MRSLRGRLTLGVAAVLAAVLLVSGASVSSYVQRTTRQNLDDRLQRTADLSRATSLDAIEQELPLTDRSLDDVLRASGTSLRLTLGTQQLSSLGRPPPVPPAPRNGFRTLEADGRHYRIYTTGLKELGNLARLEAATRLENVERTQRRLDRTLLLFGSLALLVGALAAFAFADVLLRPLSRLRRAVVEIEGDADLTRRVPTDEGPEELRALAESFDAMLARLARSSADRERALAATRRFAADVGHELRTPLTSVQANLSALRRHLDLPADRRGELLEDALTEQRRLVALLDGLQALARGDAALAHERVDLAELTDQSLEAVRAQHPGTTWVVDLPEEPVEVEGWAPGLRLVLGNLLGNAAKHGRPGDGTVRVALAAAAGEVLLTVEDDGPGVPPEERGRVFEPFARVDGTAAQGSGLGLALVAQQAGHHGARVELDDAPELGGARFRVRFAAPGQG